MNKKDLFFSIFILTGAAVLKLHSQTVFTSETIPAQAEIFGAGNDGLPDNGGQAPVEFNLPASPTVLTMISVTGTITLNSGGGHNDPDGVITSGGYSGPTISGASGYTEAFAYGGISGITIPGGGALEGVFEPAAAPAGAAPASLDFTSIGTSFTSFAPLLYQTFYIGDGLTADGSGAVQQFIVPAGATRLFLGISDAPGFYGNPGAYNDNSGDFTASFQISSGLQWLPPFTSGTNLALNFSSANSQSYLIESTTNLASANWVTNSLVTGDGTLKQILRPMTNRAQFFRLVEP